MDYRNPTRTRGIAASAALIAEIGPLGAGGTASPDAYSFARSGVCSKYRCSVCLPMTTSLRPLPASSARVALATDGTAVSAVAGRNAETPPRLESAR